MTKKTQARLERDKLQKDLRIPFISLRTDLSVLHMRDAESQQYVDPYEGCSDAVREAATRYQWDSARQQNKEVK